jgi:arginine decarboxylase
MADARRLVLITTPNDEPEWYERLLIALNALPKRKPLRFKAKGEEIRFSANEQRMGIRAATFASTEMVSLAQAQGRVAAEPIGIYPPGIALVMPGEAVDREAIEYMNAQERGGGALFGVHDGAIFVVRDQE